MNWLTVGDVARRLGVGPDAVRERERRGKLRAIRTAGGVRLFRGRDVEALLRGREHRTKTDREPLREEEQP